MTHYYDASQPSTLSQKDIPVRIGSSTYLFFSGSGVFSKDRLDNGTRALIEHAIIQGDVLDLGCGIGIVGIIAKIQHPSCQVTLMDVNQRALTLARRNAKRHKVDAHVIEADATQAIPGSYDTILTNPPYTAGRDVCFSFIEHAHLSLKQAGTLQLVVRYQKGGKVLEMRMHDIFGNVSTLARQGGYRVLKSIKTI
ncbi:MAG: methyltransferase [Nanoarchaeota archaeon]